MRSGATRGAISHVCLTRLAAAVSHDNGSGSPEHTVRDFLVSAVAEHNGSRACLYMTRGSQLDVQAVEPRGTLCEAVLASDARLTLGGEHVDSEAAVKGLTYGVERESDGRERVTVSAHGERRTFVLRPATRSELAEYAAPNTSWRIASGVERLVAG